MLLIVRCKIDATKGIVALEKKKKEGMSYYS